MLGDASLHFWLTRSMAKAIGLNLSEEMACTRLSEGDYGQMVTRCRACLRATECQAWLSKPKTQSEGAPGFCANAGMLNRLKRLN